MVTKKEMAEILKRDIDCVFTINGDRGTGKTFIFNELKEMYLNKLRNKDLIKVKVIYWVLSLLCGITGLIVFNSRLLALVSFAVITFMFIITVNNIYEKWK